MAYTLGDAKREVGNSTDLAIGLEASIKKWEQRVRGDLHSYTAYSACGLCFVRTNNRLAGPHSDCPAYQFCQGPAPLLDNPPAMLQALKDLRKEVNKMGDCSKTCANFKVKKPGSPFPNTLRTADLYKGMLVEDSDGNRFIILEPLDNKWMKVLYFRRGYIGERRESFADNGCQPYSPLHWNQSRWLKEVK